MEHFSPAPASIIMPPCISLSLSLSIEDGTARKTVSILVDFEEEDRELRREGSETVEVGLRVTQECSGGAADIKKALPSVQQSN